METLFKVGFLLLFMSAVAAALPGVRSLRRRSGAGVNQMAHELRALRVIRPALGMVFYAALLDWLLPGQRLAWAVIALPPAIRLAGAGIALGSVVILRCAFSALGESYRGGLGLWSDHTLVTRGPYRWVRHPIYSGFVAAMIGASILASNWLIALAGIGLTMSIPMLRVALEERQLAERFGDEYAAYARVTPRFIPWLF